MQAVTPQVALVAGCVVGHKPFRQQEVSVRPACYIKMASVCVMSRVAIPLAYDACARGSFCDECNVHAFARDACISVALC